VFISVYRVVSLQSLIALRLSVEHFIAVLLTSVNRFTTVLPLFVFVCRNVYPPSFPLFPVFVGVSIRVFMPFFMPSTHVFMPFFMPSTHVLHQFVLVFHLVSKPSARVYAILFCGVGQPSRPACSAFGTILVVRSSDVSVRFGMGSNQCFARFGMGSNHCLAPSATASVKCGLGYGICFANVLVVPLPEHEHKQSQPLCLIHVVRHVLAVVLIPIWSFV